MCGLIWDVPLEFIKNRPRFQKQPSLVINSTITSPVALTIYLMDRIKRFVLHTNHPGHADFNSYMKCNFVIHCSDYDGSLLQDVAITPSSKWEQVKEILGDSGPAAIQKHGSSIGYPFGSIFVYGYPNTAFEVVKNGYIATVTLFRS